MEKKNKKEIKEKIKDWEKEFNKEVDELLIAEDVMSENGDIYKKKVKSFIQNLLKSEKEKLLERIKLENPLRDVLVWAEETENPKEPNVYIKISSQSYWWEKGLKELENRFVRDLEKLKEEIRNET